MNFEPADANCVPVKKTKKIFVCNLRVNFKGNVSL